MASEADAGAVRISSLPRELVASSRELGMAEREPVVLKGFDGEHVTYAVGWAS